jgi:5-methylcytosine-specific restriction endonuclease McrA
VLNQNYEPLMVCHARRALVMLFLGRAETVESGDGWAASARDRYRLPSVVRLGRFVRRPRQEIRLTRQNVLRRDGHICAYCGTAAGPMTIDHVIPRSEGGGDSWENLVCACIPCNSRKAGRSPRQSRMPLLRQPRRPTFLSFIQHAVTMPDHRWRPYLFMESMTNPSLSHDAAAS